MAHIYDLQLYIDENGCSPFEEWFKSIRDRQVMARVKSRLNRIRIGNLGDHRSVGKGVAELRMDIGPGFRIYFGREGSKIIILLCAGDKNTQKIDIPLAQGYWADYRRRRNVPD